MSDNGGLQLLPETRRKIDISVPGENKVLTIGGVILGIAIIIIAGIMFYHSRLEGKILTLDTELQALEAQRNRDAEKNLTLIDKQVGLIGNLIESHIYWSKGLEKIEGHLQGQIQFETFSANLASGKLDFKALAGNYTTIARQIAAFMSDDSIKDVTLNSVNVLTNGRLEFNMRVDFDREKFLIAKKK